jgi:hypothetical protein
LGRAGTLSVDREKVKFQIKVRKPSHDFSQHPIVEGVATKQFNFVRQYERIEVDVVRGTCIVALDVVEVNVPASTWCRSGGQGIVFTRKGNIGGR